MALHPKFPVSPYVAMDPSVRWVPSKDQLTIEKGHFYLLPPLVQKIRLGVHAWRVAGYPGASATSAALLKWWFHTDHIKTDSDGAPSEFRYYFSQREALETVIWLYEVEKARDVHAMMRYDGTGAVSAGMFDEAWTRYVTKMATGAGKTKVMSLAVAWSYFHRLYEPDSKLSRNFLVVAPNIIVLDRLRADFDGLKIFFADPVIPDNGFAGRNWRDDFQPVLHIQDEVGRVSPSGNIFLTNVHRIYSGKNVEPSLDDENREDFFLGRRAVSDTNEGAVDLGDIVRQVDELAVINDEAHHVWDKDLAWFKSIEDVTMLLRQKGADLSFQLDVTATPKDEDGHIFPQVVSDYPLVEAIAQGVVKTPVVPDKKSRAKLVEAKSAKFSEMYRDHILLGYEEWKKDRASMDHLGKKAVLFVMVDDTKNCDEVADYMKASYPEFEGDATLVIHTNTKGDISETETAKKDKEELDRLRKLSNQIDQWESPVRCVVSVLMLREGWDVRNVTTIVGLRPFKAKSHVLPEQALGRGLRRMFFGQNDKEYVNVIGTDAFMDFVEKIKSEGVELGEASMGGPDDGSDPRRPMVIEVDSSNPRKDIAKLDIELPKLTARIRRIDRNLDALDPAKIELVPVQYRGYTETERRDIVFKDAVTDEVDHITELSGDLASDPHSVVAWYARKIMQETRLVCGYDRIYGAVKGCVRTRLFGRVVDFADPDLPRNLSEDVVQRTLVIAFKKAVNGLTVTDVGGADISGTIQFAKTRPFLCEPKESIIPKKSVFNKIVGDSLFELEFAAFLEECDDVVAYAKNYLATEFRMEYQNTDGSIAYYYPDFVVRTGEKDVWIVELKGREDLDDVRKVARLREWVKDATAADKSGVNYRALYVKQSDWENMKPKSFESVVMTLGA